VARLRTRLLVMTCFALAACVPAPAGRTPAVTGSANAHPTERPPTAAAATDVPGASPSFVRPTPRPSPTFLVYAVQAGDTLLTIARQFGTTARSIAYWNRETYPSLDPDSPTYDPGFIKVGWTLRLIPTAEVDEDDLPDPPPSPAPTATPTPTASASSVP
jgi:hypothetical protein